MKNEIRTDEEILERIEEQQKKDAFGFMIPDLISVLPFEKAKPYLKKEATEKDWNPPNPRDRESILETMKDYMPFAWDKANNERGLSAARSLCHFASWIWLIGDEDKFDDLYEYDDYGKPHLRAICEYYDWDHSQWS